MDGWPLDVVTDPATGLTYQKEIFSGKESKSKGEQMYLGDLVSADGKHDKNVLLRKNKSIGTINQIIDILNSTYFGKYHFEIAMVLRSSLLLSSILLNSEVWVNLSHHNIRSLEQIDESLLTKIL